MIDIPKYRGIKYGPLQSSFAACDCYGLVALIYRTERGIEVPQVGYKARRNGFALEGEPGAVWDRVVIPQEFDVVGFKSGQDITHCGVMLNDSDFIHIYEGGNPAVGRVSDARFRSRVAGYWRLKEKKDEANG